MRKARLEEAAGGATSSDVFLNITQQFAYTKVLDAYDIPNRVFVQLIPTRPSKFKTERVPGISHVGDLIADVEEGKPYPEDGPSEDWIDTPETRKRGMMQAGDEGRPCSSTRPACSAQPAELPGRVAGVNDEKRAITCIVDAGETNAQQYRYTWRNNKIATYGANSGTHTWDNLQTTNALSTYANIQSAWQLLVQITDPYTGEPQNVTIKHICVPPALAFTVPFALKGMVKRTAPGYAASGNPTGTEIPNPTGDIIGNIQVCSSQLFRSISGSDTTWYLGDIGGALRADRELAADGHDPGRGQPVGIRSRRDLSG